MCFLIHFVYNIRSVRSKLKQIRLVGSEWLFEWGVIGLQGAWKLGFLENRVRHPNSGKYPNQLVFIVALDGYVLLVPFVEEPEYYFLKTSIPSRKATREYLLRRNPDETP